MPKKSLMMLVFWNVLLSAALVWSLARKSNAGAPTNAPMTEVATAAPIVPKDTAALKDARIAFFFMDTVKERYALVKESADRVRAEGQRMEDDLKRQMDKAQARYTELTNKDHTYSTQADLKADQEELEKLQENIQQMRSDSQDRLDKMQTDMLRKITNEIQDFLAEYNKTARFDYIFSIQEGGQVWVGNKGLNITTDVVAGLNARHAATPAK